MKKLMGILIVCFLLLSGLSWSQKATQILGRGRPAEQSGEKMTVKDSEDHILMEVIDEGTVGAIKLPPFSASAPVDVTDKLYNVDGQLYWNGDLLTTGSSGWNLTGNAGTTPGANFVGTTDDTPLELHVDNSRVLRLEPGTETSGTSPNIIGGLNTNSVTAGVIGATISGGGFTDGVDDASNVITDNFSTISGGIANSAGNSTGSLDDATGATISGGILNSAEGSVSSVGGGYENHASGTSSIIAGGQMNIASGTQSTVGGGANNTASGYLSTVPGGSLNRASGNFSFAAGYRARADHIGTFVWGDFTAADFISTGDNQFLIRASGGVGIGTNSPSEALDVAGTVRMTGLSMPTGASAGYVMTSDAGGLGTWQPAGSSGWVLSGNSGTTPGTNFLGTTDNVALQIHVNGQRALRIEPSSSSPNIVGGYNGNIVNTGVVGAVISGGGLSSNTNQIYANYATIGGGYDNVANSGGNNSTIGGGGANETNGTYNTIGGGQNNNTAEFCSVVPGGFSNQAIGWTSFAAGMRAKANHEGCFVWGDRENADFASTGSNQFLIRAKGGVGIGTNSPVEELDVSGTVQMIGFKMPSGAVGNYVLTSDATGVGTWQSVPSSGWSLTGNTGTVAGTNFLGTIDNVAIEFKVSNQRVFRMEPPANVPNIIGGYSGNSVTASIYGATIGGGGWVSGNQNVTGNFGTIGGGSDNQAAQSATVAGGESNSASGSYSTVAGGSHNTAAGQYSFAAGRRAKANHEGSFVWGDATDADIASSGTNQFIIRATGGVGIGTNSPTASLDIYSSTGYDQVRMRTSYTPSSSSDTNGNIGDIAWDDSYFYLKTGTGWKRVALSW
jgi:hypothetical protein